MRSIGVALALVVLLGGIASAAGAADKQPPWGLQEDANAAQSVADELSGVSCTAVHWCAAVGSATGPSLSGVALTEIWTGGAWAVRPAATLAAGSQLSGVSCSSASACMAVGNYSNGLNETVTLAEWWNGRFWAALTPPNPARSRSSQLDAVSCSSVLACTAVGSYIDSAGTTLTLAERWNGRSWAIERTPNPAATLVATLNGVACTGPKTCMAVGSFNNGHANGMANATPLTLAEEWNGRSWRVLTTPDPTPAGEPTHAKNRVLYGISCISATDCTAVGTFQENLGVGASTHDGPIDTLVDRWNGKSWVLERTPNPVGSSRVLQSVSCASSTSCTAVGNYKTRTGTDLFVERWNGKAWVLDLLHNVSPPHFPVFNGVGCRDGGCTAVGSYTRGGRVVTLVERSGT